MADDDRALKMLGVGKCPLCTAHIRSRNGEIFNVQRFDIWDEDGTCIEMVNREVEESLNLIGVEVAGHHAVTSCCVEKVCDKFCSD